MQNIKQVLYSHIRSTIDESGLNDFVIDGELAELVLDSLNESEISMIILDCEDHYWNKKTFKYIIDYQLKTIKICMKDNPHKTKSLD